MLSMINFLFSQEMFMEIFSNVPTACLTIILMKKWGENDKISNGVLTKRKNRSLHFYCVHV